MKKHTIQTLDLSYMNAVPVLLRKADELYLYLVGCGGTASWLAPDIARLAVEFHHQWKQVHITFIDHDIVERANISRQNFCHAELGANKAEALAARYGPAWGIEIAAIPQQLQPTMIADSWRGVSIIIGWFRVSVFGKQAEACAEYLQKARLVLVEGRLQPDKNTGGPRIWEKQDGTPAASFEVFATEVKFLPSGGGNGGSGSGQHAPRNSNSDDDLPAPEMEGFGDNEEIPF